MTDLLKNPIFLDETAAREWLEARVWANGRVALRQRGAGENHQAPCPTERTPGFECMELPDDIEFPLSDRKTN
jgi:hypothetical protein